TTEEERRRARASDGAPDEHGYKSDAENRALQPAIDEGTVRLLTHTRITELVSSPDGRRVVAARGRRGDGREVEIRADRFVLAAGAVNSAALLLSSVSDAHPHGLANGSGLVGRNYM